MQPTQYYEITFVIYTTLMVVYIYFLNYLRLMIIETLKKKYREYFKNKIKPLVKWYNWLPFNKALAQGKLDLPNDDKIIKYAELFKKYYHGFKPVVVLWIILFISMLPFL